MWFLDARRVRFERLCGPLRADLYRFAYWLARDRGVAEDVAQETMLRAWRSFDSLADDSAARAWLLAIARREHARLHERRRLETVDVDDLSARDDAALSTTDADTDPELSDLRSALYALPDDYREPLVLQVLLGYSTDDIAAHLGLTNGAVLTRLCRARQKLRAVLTGDTEDGR